MGNLEFEIKNGNPKVKKFNNFTGKLEFEIEYFNGEKNGKAIEYSILDD